MTARRLLGRSTLAMAFVLGVISPSGCKRSGSSESAGGDATSGRGDHPLAALKRCAPHSPYVVYPVIEPARIVSNPDPVSGTDPPVANEWQVGSHRSVTYVWAGLARDSRTSGEFVINRERPCHPGYNAKHHDSVEVPGAGLLRITKAPLGPKVVHWAQRRGELTFVSRSGISGTLHLKDDTVTLGRTEGGPSTRAGGSERSGQRARRRTVAGYCANIADFRGPPYKALAIHATGLDCSLADLLVRRAHADRACRVGQCRVAGFECMSNGEPPTQTLPVRCQLGTRWVDWLWSLY
jgi:hypothetical protein